MSTPQEVARYLEDNLDGAVKKAVSPSVLSHIEFIIRQRTKKGKYIAGNARNKGYSKGHKKRRTLKGAQTSRVDMNITGGMLDAMKGRIVSNRKGYVIEFGYISGLSESTKSRIARYHNIDGAGKNKRVRQFIGLSRPEINKVTKFMKKKFGS